jgi:nitrile hydratase accessory protein
MTREPKVTDLLDREGAGAPPRRNGELVFTAPWESRVFGLTMLLYRTGRFEWDEFRTLLIEEIGDWQARHPDGGGWSYYERWQSAFERLLANKGLCDVGELNRRSASLATRPQGHDHR